MKLVRDLSVTAANGNVSAVPWDTPWGSPLSQTNPSLVLDFAAGIYGAGGSPGNLGSTLGFTRSSLGGYFDGTGALAVAGTDVARIEHDPNSLAPIGMSLEVSRTNLFIQSDVPADQTVAVTATSYVLSFYGAGTVTLNGAYTATIVGAGAFPARTELAFIPIAGDLVITLTGDVSAPQFEEGAIASSYMASGAVAESRANDVAVVALGGWFDTAQGTLVFSGTLLDAAANDRIVEIDGGDTATRISILWNTTLNKPQFQVWNGGALEAAIAPSGNAVPLGNNFRVAVSWSANDFVVSLNGSSVVADTLGAVPSGLANLRIGRSVWGAQGLLQAESLVYYPSRLADTEISALSS